MHYKSMTTIVIIKGISANLVHNPMIIKIEQTSENTVKVNDAGTQFLLGHQIPCFHPLISSVWESHD